MSSKRLKAEVSFTRQASKRQVHARRIPDILMGSVLNSTKKKARELALQKKLILADSRTRFNDVIRANSPTVYLVDPDLIAKSAIDALVSEEGNNQYISTITSNPEEGPTSRENKDFASAFEFLKTKIPIIQQEISIAVTDHLRNSFKVIKTKEFSDIVNDVYINMVESLQKAETKKNKVYADFRVAAARAGAEVRRNLNNLGVSILEDPEVIFQNVNNRIAFVGFTFDTTVSKINSVVQSAINSAVSKSSVVQINKETFKIGNLVHAGHVGVYSDKGIVGINMPSGIIAGIATNKLEQIEQAIGNIPLHIEHGLKLTKNFGSAGGILLDLQFNFAVSMEAGINSKILGPQEQAAIRSVVGAITDEALFEVLRSRTGAEAFAEIAANAPDIASSDTATEYIEKLVTMSIVGNQLLDFKQNNPIFKGTTIKSPNLSLSNKQKVSSKTSLPGKTKPNTRYKQTKAISSSYTSLLNLLNLMLKEQIKKNMGSGTSKQLLNYRTGRLAGSAKVTKVSESRQGTITAFYSYMKNPYATFSTGGKQEFPRSRDPKLLISKSIREIAADYVQNKLRAVAL